MRLLAAAFLLLALHDVTSFELDIQPKFKVINERNNVTVICRASSVRLADCQFTWWDLDDHDTPETKFDFHLGPESESAYKVNGSEVNYRLAGYRYVGSGLESGECGIQLLGVSVRFRILSCRARELGKGWKYAYMTIKGNVSTEVEEFEPAVRAPVVLKGQPFTIMSKAQSPLRNCSFRFNDMAPIVVTSNRTNNNQRPNNCRRGQNSGNRECIPREHGNNFWVSKGPPLINKRCTITVRNVTENINGLFYFEAWTESGHDRRILHITVAEPPSFVNLTGPQMPVIENTLFEATCDVGPSRPLANVTWYLGDKAIRQDALDDSSAATQNDSPWRWDHELHTLSQTIIINATRDLNQKDIKCVVKHLAHNETITVKLRVKVMGFGDETESDTGYRPPSESVKCPDVPHQPHVDMECWYGNTKIDCSKPMEVGSVVKMSLMCPGNSRFTGNMTCLSTGEWKRPILNCMTAEASTVSGCGKPRVSLQSITSNGEQATKGQFPWHVAIYKLINGKYEQVCSGSLLSLTAIVTAASCFVKSSWNMQQFNSSMYTVVAGNLHRNWEFGEKGVQKRAVASLTVAPYFAGESSSYSYNLAILKVSPPFHQTEDVGPVCFDKNLDPQHQQQFLVGKYGFVAGWGLTEEDRPGATLKAVRLPHVNSERCRHLVPAPAERLIIIDSFCAGSSHIEHGYSACTTDYGAGIVFFDNSTETYVLRGVASIAFKPVSNNEICYPVNVLNFDTFFTLENWLDEHLGLKIVKPHLRPQYGAHM